MYKYVEFKTKDARIQNTRWCEFFERLRIKFKYTEKCLWFDSNIMYQIKSVCHLRNQSLSLENKMLLIIIMRIAVSHVQQIIAAIISL